MPTVIRHLRIDAPPDLVFRLIADVPRQPEWMHDLRSIRMVTPGPPRVGSVMVGEVRMFGLSQEDPVEIVALDPPHRYAIAHRGAFCGHGEFVLRPLEGGTATHVRWTERLDATGDVFPLVRRLRGWRRAGVRAGRLADGLARVVDPLFRPIFTWVFRSDMRRLRALVLAELAPRKDDGATAPERSGGA